MTDLDILGRKAVRPIGMLGTVAEQDIDQLRQRWSPSSGGWREIDADDRAVTGVAVVGAMTAPVVQEANGRGAGIDVTGQLRAPARPGVEATGLGVIAVGHQRAELWGPRALVRELREEWPELRVMMPPGTESLGSPASRSSATTGEALRTVRTSRARAVV